MPKKLMVTPDLRIDGWEGTEEEYWEYVQEMHEFEQMLYEQYLRDLEEDYAYN